MATKDQFTEASADKTAAAFSGADQDDVRTFSLPPRSAEFDLAAAVRQHPVTALLTAAVAGAVLSRLLK